MDQLKAGADVLLVSAQLLGTALGIAIAMLGGGAVYGLLRVATGLRLSAEEEFDGADVPFPRISATPEEAF